MKHEAKKKEKPKEWVNEWTNERMSEQKCWRNKQTRPQFKEIFTSLAKVIVFHVANEWIKKTDIKMQSKRKSDDRIVLKTKIRHYIVQ